MITLFRVQFLLIALVVFVCGGCGVCGQIKGNKAPKAKAPKATVTQVTTPVLHAEGPHWNADEGVLYFVDITGQLINRFDPATGNNTITSINVGGDVGFAIPVSGQPGRLLAGVGHDLVYVNWTGENHPEVANLTFIATVDHRPGQEDNRWNDAKADASGRLWAGTMGGESNGVVNPQQGSLYSLGSTSNMPLRELGELDVSNGIIWNAANSVMYFIDSPTRKVDAMDFFLTAGVISSRHSIFNLDDFELPGVPDGMTIDSDGHLWVALWDGGRIIKIDPVQNWMLEQVEIPAKKVTSLTFGGPNLDILYVTTSRRGLTEEEIAQQPGAGAVFAVEGLGVTGVPGGNNKVVRE